MAKNQINQLVFTCPICHAPRQMLTTKLINRNRTAELLHITCSACQGAVMALVFNSGPLVSSIGLVTDLSGADVARLQTQAVLQEDDIIAWHEFLRKPNVVQQLLSSEVM